MATSSFKKDFVVYSEEAYNKILSELDVKKSPSETEHESYEIEKGEELLKQFSFRSPAEKHGQKTKSDVIDLFKSKGIIL